MTTAAAPPWDHLAERTVVGALMDRLYVELAGNNEPHLRIIKQIADAGLRAGHFHDQRCRYAFAAIMRILDRGEPVDEPAVARYCARSEMPEHRGVTLEWLLKVSDDLTTIAGVDWYAAEIVRLSERRRVIAAAEAIAAGDGDPQRATTLIGATTDTRRRTIGL